MVKKISLLRFFQVINKFLSLFAFRIVRTSTLSNDDLSLTSTLSRLNSKVLPAIKTIIDVGASNGSWTKQVQAFLPGAFYFLIEANRYHERELAVFKAQASNVDYIMAATGDTVGEINFDATAPMGGVATHSSLHEYKAYNLQPSVLIQEIDFIRIPVTTIDHLVEERKLKPPFFLKLDVHGFEVPILRGAESTLSQTNLIQIECYNFPLTKDTLKFHEMVAYLETRGFRVIDLCDPIHRPFDLAFWQLDLFFIPASSEQFLVNTYVRDKAINSR